MDKCEACQLTIDKDCICPAVDEFFKDAEFSALMDELAKTDTAEYDEAQAALAPNASRCDGCMFFRCRCASGLKSRMEKL